MPLGQLLVERNLIDPEQLEAAIRHRKIAGGSLAESLAALDLLSEEELESFLSEAPPEPESIEDTGLDPQFLLNFLLKTVYLFGLETSEQVSESMKLPAHVVELLFQTAKDKRLVEVLGLSESRSRSYRYALTSTGRQWAMEAFQASQYAGPLPVPLANYQSQVIKQSITRERITPDAMKAALSHLVLADGTIGRLGPALNSGKAILIYGAVGNGKTSIAEALGHAFSQSIYVPYCIEVDNQIIRVFDPAMHTPCEASGSYEPIDPRWVRCRRPVVMTGGELTMEMLDLSFDPVSKTYEAPAHIKAAGGVFIIDDFGRQRVRPRDLVNRWILPLERRVDFLTLHTGKKLQIPFDELIIFSTNFPPKDLMDEAGLRRVPYKFEMPAPNPAQYEAIFQQICEAHKLTLPREVLTYLFDAFYPETGAPLSSAHPKFIVEHVFERCHFEGIPPALTLERVREALLNLVIGEVLPAGPAASPAT
jgi:hypothetical protein